MRFTQPVWFLSGGLALLSCASNATPVAEMEEVYVEASLIPTSLRDVTHGISFIGGNEAKQSHKVFVAELLSSAPNVNFSSGASRGRFFQIRGTGERSQFVDPIAPSVGYTIDGVDFSTAGNIGALYDIERIEVLRGPQGTVFGSSASAGLINVISNNPTAETQVIVNAGVGAVDGNDGSVDSHQAGIIVNGAMTDYTNARLSLFRNVNDGFVNNEFLDKDNTDDTEETVARAKFSWNPSQQINILTTIFHSDVNNGYDGFTLDNVRNTITDEPGHDKQETTAINLKARYSFENESELVLELAGSHDKTDYGYYEDWTFDGFDPGGYMSFDQYQRKRNLKTVDLRYESAARNNINWTTGVYLNRQDIDLDRIYTFALDFDSDYETESIAAYGEISVQTTDRLLLSAGIRIEEFDAKYSDSLNEKIKPDETLWGGQLSASFDLNEEVTLFSRLSRGFKAAGVNANGAGNLIEEFKEYDSETLINYELGSNYQSADGSYSGQVTLFYQQRDDAQIKQSQVMPITAPNCPCDFEDYISNAQETQHYGIEIEGQYVITDALTLDVALGYLEAEFSDYTRITEGAGGQPLGEDLDGRQLAHAPEYTFSVSTSWAITEELALWVNLEGRDRFFFSNRHELKSDAYELLNASLSYSIDNWQVSLWGKNLLDEDYYVRGFGSFNNDPRDGFDQTMPEPYFQFGMPAEYGLSAEYRFK